MIKEVHLPPFVGAALFLLLAVFFAICFFRASDIAKFTAKSNREGGWEFLARSNESESNIWTLRIISLVCFIVSCYIAYDYIFH